MNGCVGISSISSYKRAWLSSIRTSAGERGRSPVRSAVEPVASACPDTRQSRPSPRPGAHDRTRGSPTTTDGGSVGRRCAPVVNRSSSVSPADTAQGPMFPRSTVQRRRPPETGVLPDRSAFGRPFIADPGRHGSSTASVRLSPGPDAHGRARAPPTAADGRRRFDSDYPASSRCRPNDSVRLDRYGGYSNYYESLRPTSG